MYQSPERPTIDEGRHRVCKRSIPRVVRAYGQSAHLLHREPHGRNHRQGGCRPLSFPREPYFLKLIRIVEVRADEWPVGQEYTRYVHVQIFSWSLYRGRYMISMDQLLLCRDRTHETYHSILPWTALTCAFRSAQPVAIFSHFRSGQL
jgi:hypothetical protein